ncbi:hypothetical protein F5Y13DRAFT_200350 [Hypoxylon sp. FL1857]|nr:hypothetical protein F5Y13DRAFT_200350 [Hypoxylon sp. FL1857]
MESSNLRTSHSSNRTIVVGIDFGTTFSGIAWAETEIDSEPRLINDWPTSRTDNEESGCKVPTILRYLKKGQFEWGYQIPYGTKPQDILSLFKLGLEPDKFMSSIDTIGKPLNFDNIDQKITHYLTGLFEHFRNAFNKLIGTENTLQSSPVKFVLTVPAIWSDRAQQRTIEAFERIPNLPKDHSTVLLSEPEAAAIAALRAINPRDLKVNESLIIVDAGGGTVDLITYTIKSLHPILEVVEATRGTGDFCGSSRVNDRFIQFLASRLGAEEGWDEDVLYDATKRKFNMDSLIQKEAFLIPVLGLNPNVDLRIKPRGRLELRAEELHKFFEPDIVRIIQLVKQQIAMSDVPIRKILLVGGYGSSMYLRERLQIAVQSDAFFGDGIEILQPPNAWTAVVNGAVIKGMSIVKPGNHDIPVVKARVGRKHYGYEFSVVFDKSKHESLRSKMYYDDLDGNWRVPVMHWIIKRGELVSEGKPFRKIFHHRMRVSSGRPRMVKLQVYADEVSDVPPLSRNNNVKAICLVTADLSHIPEGKFIKKVGHNGEMYYNVEFQIESICSLIPISTLWVFADDYQIGLLRLSTL